MKWLGLPASDISWTVTPLLILQMREPRVRSLPQDAPATFRNDPNHNSAATS